MDPGNFTSNSSGRMPGRGRRSTKSLDFAIPYTAASATFSLIGGLSNLFVLFILIRYVGLKQNTNVYMLSLFISDFLYNCVVQPQVCYYQFPSSIVTLVGSKYIHAAALVCILTGTLSLFFASLDKFMLINYPFFSAQHITKKKTRVVVVFIWLVCVSVGAVRYHDMLLFKDGYLIMIATSFLLTILIQIMIFVVAREQDKRIQQLHRSLEHNHPRADERIVQRQGSNKAAKTVGLLLAVYIATWLPVNIYRQEYRWNGGDYKVYHRWIKIVNLMIQLHSCINPWIFVLRSKDMKVAVATFFRAVLRLGGEANKPSEDGGCGNRKNTTASSGVLSNDDGIGGDSKNELNISVESNDKLSTAGNSAQGLVNASYRNSWGDNGNRAGEFSVRKENKITVIVETVDENTLTADGTKTSGNT